MVKALITAGGRGTRLRPITHTSNKHLIPIANKPMLFYAIEAVAAAGIREIGLVFGAESHAAISAAIAPFAKQGLRFTLLIQESPKGLAHVVKLAETFIADEPFVFYLGDNLMADNVARCIGEYSRQRVNCLLVLAAVPDPQRFGVAEIKEDRVIGVEEKPANPKSRYAVTGLYIYDRTIFEAVSQLKPSGRGELEISDAHQYLIDHGFHVGHTEISGWWKDTGKPEDLLEANRLVLERMVTADGGVQEVMVDKASSLTGMVRLEPGARVVASQIRGPAIIGRDSLIEKSTIGPHTSVGDRCRIVGSAVEESILMEGCQIIEAGVRIERSLLGRNVEIVRGIGRPGAHQLIVGDRSHIMLPSADRT